MRPRLNQDSIAELYTLGKQVYNEEISLDDAVKQVLLDYPDDVSENSAKFYIQLYSDYRTGKGSTWNQNCDLVYYYAEHILEEYGADGGQSGYLSALRFAKDKTKTKLIKDLESLWERYSPKHQTGRYDSWEVVDEVTAIKTCDKAFFTSLGSSIPRPMTWFFDAESMEYGETKNIIYVYNGIEYPGTVRIDELKRIRLFWRKALGDQLAVFQAVAVANAKYRKIAPDKYELTMSINAKKDETTMPASIKDALSAIKSYIFAAGFDYPEGLIENFYLSLKSKPFVILAGTSGTGKTKLVRLFAQAMGAEYKLVPVRPDWSDSTDLFGHVDLNGQFIPGTILEFLKRAEQDPGKSYFLCLDEMNLARVEYYLSDFLSVMETRRFQGSGIVSDNLISAAQYGSDIDALGAFGEISFPDNLYVIGTVNMDETTFPFSKKVLDRANTIEFNYVDLMPKARTDEACVPQELPNSFLRTDYLVLANDCTEDWEYVETACSQLQKINSILRQANAHIGFRVRDEIIFYLLNNRKADLLADDDAMDLAILQKILPRIQGSAGSIRDMLCRLFCICAEDHSQRNGSSDSEKMQKVLDDNSSRCRYRRSAEKLQLMVQRFEEDGFTSYWL